MPTTKKKPAGPAEAPAELTRITPAKPRNVAAYEAAVAEFSLGTDLFGKGQFADAAEHFASVIASATQEEPILADRARTFASICAKRAASPDAGGQDAEGLYHRAVLASNAGQLDEAWSMLERALASRPADASIAIDPTLRFHAASDSDFDAVRDEAAFIDVIEPSHTGA
jgi:tetratricopeptide (TPR) repeat protein